MNVSITFIALVRYVAQHDVKYSDNILPHPPKKKHDFQSAIIYKVWSERANTTHTYNEFKTTTMGENVYANKLMRNK